MAPLKISLSLGLLLGVLLLPNAEACWSSRSRSKREPKIPKEYKGASGDYPFSPNAWEIEAIANIKFKPHVNKLEDKSSYINSVKTGKPCFGNGEGKYTLVTDKELREHDYYSGDKIFMFRAIRDHLNEVADQYLSKYCKDHNECQVNTVQNNYICVDTDEDQPSKTHGAGKSPDQVLKYLKFYLFSEYKKYYRKGETEYEDGKIDTGKSCVQPPYKLPFDRRPTKTERDKMDEIASEYLGVFCKSDKCNYHLKSKTFRCGSSTSKPMALHVALILVTSGLLYPLFS